MRLQMELNEDNLLIRGDRLWLREVRKTVKFILAQNREHSYIDMQKTHEGYELRVHCKNAPKTRDALVELVSDYFGFLAEEFGGTEVITPINARAAVVN